MSRPRRYIIALMIWIGLTGAASGTLQPEAECVPYENAYESAPLFRVKAAAGQSRVYLYKETRQCPNDQPCASREKVYLLDGDVVFAGPLSNGFRCSYYGTPKGKIIAGFLPEDNLSPENSDAPLTADFLVGIWRFEDDSIEIKAAGPGKIEASGEALYKTAMTENDGAFTASAAVPVPQELVLRDGEGDAMCEVKLRRRGPYLVANDNRQCGGMNVTFEGIYTKTPPH